MFSKLPRGGTTIFTRMSALAQETGALNLSQGFPDFDAPAGLVRALGEHALAGHNQYALMAGLPRLRVAIADQLRRWRGVAVDPGPRRRVDSSLGLPYGSQRRPSAALLFREIGRRS